MSVLLRVYQERNLPQATINTVHILSYHILYVLKTYFQYLQSAKILLLPPKYGIIMVPSNHSNFQYCDRNIGLFSIAPCKVITHYPLRNVHPFLHQFFASFFMASFLKLSHFQLSQQRQLSLFLALKGDSEKITVTFR